MQFSLAYNGDTNLIEKTSHLDKISTYYGSMSSQLFGSGRPTLHMAKVDKANIEQAVELAHHYNKKFNYLMNSSCMNNLEYTEAYRCEIFEMLRYLEDIQVDLVTIANPLLIEWCANYFPNLRISVSSFLLIDSIEAAKYYDDLGVAEITLRNGKERDLPLIKKINDSVRCDIQVMVNQVCLRNCPFQSYHNNVISHMSQNVSSDHCSLDYCSAKCTMMKFEEPVRIIQSTWIRPDDIKIYEQYGITHGKITDRSKSTEWLVNTAEAYCSGTYNGDLSKILNINQYNNTNKRSSESEYVLSNLKNIHQLGQLNVNINNEKLEGFLSKLLANGCVSASCNNCGYCEYISSIAIEEDSNNKKRLAVIEKN